MIYFGEHSISFDGKNTWTDWNLAPTSKPTFAPPKFKTKLVTIEGASSVLDLSTSLTGYPTYENSEGSWTFLWDAEKGGDWAEAYSRIMSYLHGRRHKAILEDDPGYFREGLFTINKYESKEHTVEVEISYSVSPYKRELTTIAEQHPDVFTSIPVSSSSFVDIIPNLVDYLDEEPVCPTFTVDEASDITLKYYNKNLNQSIERYIPVGTNVNPLFVFGTYGDNVVKLQAKGTGFISINFRNGRL